MDDSQAVSLSRSSYSTSQIFAVPQIDLDEAVNLKDPLDSLIFQPPVKVVNKRRRAPSAAASKRIAPPAVMPVSDAERKAQEFIQQKLATAIAAEVARTSVPKLASSTSSVEDHSIAGGSYIDETCRVVSVHSMFSTYLSDEPYRSRMSESFIACTKLIAIQAYNGKADNYRRDRLINNESVGQEYMELVKKADMFRTWRSTLYTSLLINLNEASDEHREYERHGSAEDYELPKILNPLALQKFLGYLLWIPMERSTDTLAGKKQCYTCSSLLREGQSYCCPAPRLVRINRTGIPQSKSNAAVSTSQLSAADKVVRDSVVGGGDRPVEIVESTDNDRIVHFQICSQCDEMVGLWLAIMDIFRNERNCAIRFLNDSLASCKARGVPPPKLAAFVEQYMTFRAPEKIWQDLRKWLRALVNPLGMFLRKACSERIARAARGLFHDMFEMEEDPRANPFNKPIESMNDSLKSALKMVDMTVEQRLNHLLHMVDPNAVEDIGALWVKINR
jgi:hypothetical protein